jgi:hypothetical protein
VSEAANRPQVSPWIRYLALGVLWIILASVIAITQLATQPMIEINWKTASEFDTAGFNIYRSDAPDQGYQQINNGLIHGAADTASGAEYSFVDKNVQRGATYYYRLEDVEYDNTTTLHEFVTGRADTIELWAIVLIGLCIVIGLLFLIHAFRSRSSSLE